MTTAPPPEFVLYGWNGEAAHRLDWVHTYRREGVTTTYGVWLAHLTDAGGLRVGSFDTGVLGRIGPDAATAAARHGAHALVDITLPTEDLSVASASAEHATRAAQDHGNWRAAEWVVDGGRVEARVWKFAGGWTGFAVLGDVTVVLVGVGVGVDPGLSKLNDTRAYGFDHTVPIDRAHHRGEQRQWVESLLPRPNRARHADHTALVG
ncbi:hypothetical protein [Actinokineospora diospyrosa]|uniref:Uncharacterized protein n=1 Tax=Actinokineospora diospyrosa TaxID=103728 RepID=A0ABT1IEW3_9PSEU|nr:hypothetical protein [Actinokineospora diospyrosa]MCP2271172.1 hypothetical protein [Actinokineospora diospyrosa]